MTTMSKRIVISAASMLIAASMIQTATAAERTKKSHVVPAASEQVRNANAYVAPLYVNRYEGFRDEALSPPAGH
jgi:hypothetical protein